MILAFVAQIGVLAAMRSPIGEGVALCFTEVAL
jgi:hypothetical protein